MPSLHLEILDLDDNRVTIVDLGADSWFRRPPDVLIDSVCSFFTLARVDAATGHS